MRLGVRAHDYGKNTPEEMVKKIKEAGFGTLQLAIPKAIEGIENFEQITPGLLEHIREVFKAQGMDIAVFGCYIEPSLLDQEERRLQVNRFLKALTYSKIIEAPLVGTETTHFRADERERSKAFQALTDSVLRMVEKAEEIDAVVGMEPVSVHTLNTPELTYTLLEKVKSHKLKIIFDPVNLLTPANINNQSKLWQECFQAFGSNIAVVHVKDVIFRNNIFEPVVLGEGITEYEEIFKWLKIHKPDISLLREDTQPETAYKDIAFLKEKIV